MKKNSRPKHVPNQSLLYNITSPEKLAAILRLSSVQTEMLLSRSENYIRFIANGDRDIQWPKPLLRAAHKRVAVLLSRIETPDFLHSAVRGRSYISNAQPHRADQPTVKIDLRKFFPSVRAPAIFHYFRDTMHCAGDAAGIMTKLLTVDGHLPTGSSVSPILSYFAYEKMFCEMRGIAFQRDCVMTCYVDDMTFTGRGATRELIYEVTKIAKRYRQWTHKTKIFRAGQPKVITGVAVTQSGARLPNKRQKAIAEDLSLHAATQDEEMRTLIARRVVSRMYEAAQIEPIWRKRAETFFAHHLSIKPSFDASSNRIEAG
jgi:hypothetical protein